MPMDFDIQDVTLSVVTVNSDTFPRPILAVCFNQNSKHNIISESFISSLAYALEVAYRLVKEDKICAVVFCSAKSSFIVGADIQFQLALDTTEKCLSVCFTVQELLSIIEALPVVTVAVLNGLALGGGLELALACDYRVADWQHGQVGLPEVIVGLLPAAGGCCRLPLLIGLKKALDLILTGKTVGPKEARELGIADALIHNSSSVDNGQLSYCWVAELCNLWRNGNLGSQRIISDEAEKSKDKDLKSKSKAASGKGNARARMMRQNNGQSEAPQRQVSYRVAHIALPKKAPTYRDLTLLANRDMVQSLLDRSDAKARQRYKRRWSCWLWLEQHLVYRTALKMIESKSHGIYPGPYMCLLATLQAWQKSSMQDALVSTLDYYVPLVLSPEAKCLMHAFLDLRACAKKALNFGIVERNMEKMQSEAMATSQLSPSKSSASSSRSTSPIPSGDREAETGSVDGSSEKRQPKKKKKRQQPQDQSLLGEKGVGDKQSSHGATVDIEMVGSALSRSDGHSAEVSDRKPEEQPCTRPVDALRSQSVEGETLATTVGDLIDPSRCAITVIGDVCPQSLAMAQLLLLTDMPVFFLCPDEASAQAAASRIRLQLNHNLKRGVISPTRKMAYINRLAVGHLLSKWDQWLNHVAKEVCRHHRQDVQNPDPVLYIGGPLTHIVVISSGVGTATYVANELKKTVQHVMADQSGTFIPVRSCCCISTPATSCSAVGQWIGQPGSVIPVHFFNIENSRTRCVEISLQSSSDRKESSESWAARAVALLVSRTNKTPVITETSGGVHVSVHLFLSMLETFFRLVVYGGHNVQKLDQALVSSGFSFGPLHLLAKLGYSALQVCDEITFQRFPTVKAILDTIESKLGSGNGVKKETDVDGAPNFRVYSNLQQVKLSPEFQAIVKESRKVLSKQPKMAAVVAGCRRLNTQDCVQAILLSVVNESIRYIQSAEAAHLDLLACLNMPYFPAAHGGPLYYAERLGWESVGHITDKLLCECVYTDMVVDKRPLSGKRLDELVSTMCTPVLCKGHLVQTLFPKRPPGIGPSVGLCGLQNGMGKMPWFAPYDTGRLLTILLMIMVACLAFLLYQLVVHFDQLF